MLLESLEVVLIAAAFDQDISLVFSDDGVYQLTKDQNTDGIGMKNFSKTYSALGDYDIKKIYVEKESLEERGLSVDDLQALKYEDEDMIGPKKNSLFVVGRDELTAIIDDQDVILSF